MTIRSGHPGRLLVLFTGLSLLATGCSGPAQDVRVGFREVPTDVVLGAQANPTPFVGPSGGLAPPGVPPLPPPGVLALPPPPFEPVPTGPGGPAAPPAALPTAGPPTRCPPADPLQAPALEAPATITAPPTPRQYIFANVGRFQVSGADPRSGVFPAASLRTVGQVRREGNTFAFDVAELLGNVTTTTTYRVVTAPAATAGGPADVPADTGQGPGLYVERVASTRGGESPASFTPVPTLRLAALPLVRGAAVQSRGVDPTSATAMSFTATVLGKARLDICGQPLDSFVLELTDGRLISPRFDLTFAATYAVGTQYGGLVLRDTVAFAGTDAGAGTSRTNTATITTEPAVPVKSAARSAAQ